MYNILTLNSISEIGLNELPSENYNITNECKSPDAVLLRSASMHEMELPESLLAIARAGAGTNNIPIDKCSEKGIVVFNTPGANANAVKELVIAALLMSSRKIVDGINWVNTLKDDQSIEKTVESGKSQFQGPEISGKKLGVIGLGAIGVLVANAAEALGMDVYGFDPYISIDSAWGLSKFIKKSSSIDEILKNCDFITLHIPLLKETKALINEKSFSTMKKGMKVLNFSRAELVDPVALKVALEDETVGTYVTDFPTKDIINLENVIAIPHLGASTYESEENCAYMAARSIKDFLELGLIINSVNLPDCNLPCTSKVRILIINKNKANEIGLLAGVLGAKGINIENMLNRGKGNWACTIVDTDQLDDLSVVDEIKALDGIVSVRVIRFE